MDIRSFTILYVIAAVFDFADPRRCFSILPQVKTLSCPHVNYTSLSPQDQNITAFHLLHFKPLHRTACSSATRTLVCAAFLPFCDPNHPEIYVPPCRHLCLSVKAACLHLFRSVNLPWPAKLNCTALPDPPQLCFASTVTLHSTTKTTYTPTSSSLSEKTPFSLPTLLSPSTPSPSQPTWHLVLIIGLPALSFCCFVALIIWFILRVCRRRQELPQPGPATVTFSAHSP